MLDLTRRGLLAATPLLALAPQALAAAPSGREPMARALVAALNGDTSFDAFAATWLSPAGRNHLDDWRETFAQVRAVTGGLDYVGVSLDEPREMLVAVRTRRQGLSRELTLRPDREDRQRLYDLFAIARPRIYAGPVPARPLSRSDLRAALAKRVEDAVARDEFSGAVRVVAPDGKVVYEAAHGFANRDDGARITPQTRFHLGSADKSFTALMIGGLIGEGKLSLDTRLIEVLPDYPNAEAAGKITIRHLLSHAAGLADLWSRPKWDGRKPYASMAEILPTFAAEPLRYAPGTSSGYSNEGFIVLGAVIERLRGTSWYDQLAGRIYGPADMAHSGHFTLSEVVPGRAVGYRYPPEDVLGLSARQPNWIFMGYRGNSCGGGYSTVGDMTNYLRALRAGEILPLPIVETLTARNVGGLANYGYGFNHKKIGERTVRGHAGGGPASGIDGDSAIVWETGWAYSILGNYDAPFASVISRDIATMLAAQEA